MKLPPTSSLLRLGGLTLGLSLLVIALQTVLIALSLGDGPNFITELPQPVLELLGGFIVSAVWAYPTALVGAGALLLGIVRKLLKYS
jgi:hypothetical protein